jgi:excisionase family DNA binding protein
MIGEAGKIVLMLDTDYLTPDEAAIELGLSSSDLVYRLLRARQMRATKVGSRWLIPRAEVALRKLRVQEKKSSASYRPPVERGRAASRFAPLPGTPGASS